MPAGSVVGDDPFLNEVATHLIEAGGKRLRPSLDDRGLVPAAPARSLEEILLGGVSVELVHLASLYHDDVMDEATRRRNVESVNARWGNLVAIVAGDFLLARSAEIAASLGTEVAGLLAATLARLCQGQVAEVRAAFQIDRDEEDYLRCIADKTAALMSTACRIGALTAGLDRTQIDALTAFGEGFGMVFQIRDDVLDVVASESELGKPPGQDLAEGIYTLPVQRALARPPRRSAASRPARPPARPGRARGSPGARGGVARDLGRPRDRPRTTPRTAADAAERLGDGLIPKALVELGHNVVDDLERTLRGSSPRAEREAVRLASPADALPRPRRRPASRPRRLRTLRRAQGREEDHLADVRDVGEQHHEAVDAEPEAAGRRQPVLEGPQEVLSRSPSPPRHRAARSRSWSSKRARWSSGSTSSLKALPSSRPAMIGSKRST